MWKAKKRNIIKHKIIAILICILLTLLWYAIINTNSQSSYKTETIAITEPCVYVTTYGERYHSVNCSYLAKSQHAMGKQEAISKGYTACSRCGGISSGTITVTYTKHVEIYDAYKNIGEVVVFSALCTAITYLFIYFTLTDILNN